MEQEVILGIYKHYKGFFVQIIAVGAHTENDERLVAYIPLSIDTVNMRSGPVVAMRPLNNFFATIDENGTKRFEYVGHVKN